MSRASRARRQARQRRQERRSTGRATPSGTRGDLADARGMADQLLRLAASTRGPQQVRALDALAGLPLDIVLSTAEALLVVVVSTVWTRGWSPAEAARAVRLRSRAPAGRLAAAAIAADHRGRAPATLDARWAAEVSSMARPDGAATGWAATWAAGEGLGRRQTCALLAEVLAALWGLPFIDPVIPAPGTTAARGSSHRPDGTVDPVLGRIRSLLAKAEATTFEAEAEAYTAKAAELMARHAVTAAALAASSGAMSGETPTAIRVYVDAPYVEPKTLLLQGIATAHRCRAVGLQGLDMSSVIGFATDLAAVELVYTSLLVQAATALAAMAAAAPAGTHTRSARYRTAFWTGYAVRIGQRLVDAVEDVYASHEGDDGTITGVDFLPVLAARADAVDEELQARFPDLRSATGQRWLDPAGWAGGVAAADAAHLHRG